MSSEKVLKKNVNDLVFLFAVLLLRMAISSLKEKLTTLIILIVPPVGKLMQ